MNALTAGLWLILSATGPWLLAEPGRAVADLVASHDGRYLAVRIVAGQDSITPPAIAVIELASGAAIARVGPADGLLSAPVWLPGARLVAAAEDGLWLWDEAGRRPPVRYRIPLAAEALSASADGRRLAASTPDGAVVLDPRTGAVVRRFALPAPVLSLLLDADGSHLITTDGSRLTRWELSTGARVAQQPASAIESLAWADPAGFLAAGAGVTRHQAETLAPVRRWPGIAARRAVVAFGEIYVWTAEARLLRLAGDEPESLLERVGCFTPLAADKLAVALDDGVRILAPPRSGE